MPEPTGHRNLEPEKHEVVAHDHLPRASRYLTTYDDGSSGETLHVLYWGGAVVQSMESAEWVAQRGALPGEPTQAEIDAALAAQAQATAQAQSDAAQLRQRVLGLANSAVGIQVDNLTAAQVRALVVLLLWKNGAIDRTGAVRPPADWL